MIRRPERLEWIKEMNKLHDTDAEVYVGEDVYIHPTATVGSSGVGFEIDEEGNKVRCKQLGDVTIEDYAHIGPHCDIKRSTLPGTSTTIGASSDLCSFANIGHNCKIGKVNFIGPHACLNGSVETGDNVWISGHAVIHQNVKIGEGAIVGMGAVVRHDVLPGETVVGVPAVPIRFVGNYIHPSFVYGENLKMGRYNHIHEGVNVGNNVTIRSYVELRKGTIIGDNCYIDSGVVSSGRCTIGDRVTLRYNSIIARGTRVMDDIFISPQLMTENLNHLGNPIGGAQIGIGEWNHETKYRVFIGTDVTLAAGIEICPDTIIGSKANVRKSIKEPGIYVGNPARVKRERQ